MSFNRVILIGRLGAAPERKPNSSGQALAIMRLATDRWQKDGKAEEPDWHTVVTWGKTAEQCLTYLEVGRQVAVEGQLRTRRWKDPTTGAPRCLTEVVAGRVTFLDRARAPGASAPPAGESGTAGVGTAEATGVVPAPPNLEDPDDDPLPF
jgi:single-strand DNA-binding protein